ncbi:unnamed protein product [Brassica oleracea]
MGPQLHKGCKIPLHIGRERGSTLGHSRDVSPPRNAKHGERCFRPRDQGLHSYRHQSLSGFPPSSGSFSPNFRIFIAPVINFLVSKKSPLLVNIYTYFTYVNNMRDVRLEYALLTPSETVVTDGSNTYRNLFFAILDTAYVALEELSGGAVKFVVSESGWPTAGGTAASVYNARTYVKNLIQTVNSKTGSPRRPERVTETYLLLDFDIRLVNNCSDISGSRLDNRR